VCQELVTALEHTFSPVRECYRTSQHSILTHRDSYAGWGLLRKADTRFCRPVSYGNSRLKDCSRTTDTGLPAHTASSSTIPRPQPFRSTTVQSHERYNRDCERSY